MHDCRENDMLSLFHVRILTCIEIRSSKSSRANRGVGNHATAHNETFCRRYARTCNYSAFEIVSMRVPFHWYEMQKYGLFRGLLILNFYRKTWP